MDVYRVFTEILIMIRIRTTNSRKINIGFANIFVLIRIKKTRNFVRKIMILIVHKWLTFYVSAALCNSFTINLRKKTYIPVVINYCHSTILSSFQYSNFPNVMINFMNRCMTLYYTYTDLLDLCWFCWTHVKQL